MSALRACIDVVVRPIADICQFKDASRMTHRLSLIMLMGAVHLAGCANLSIEQSHIGISSRPAEHSLAAPLSPGRYCLKSEMLGFTGTGKDVPLGPFLMQIRVTETPVGYGMAFWNKMPDSPQILFAQTDVARITADGGLVFDFTDGWSNQGRIRVGSDGRVVLVQTRTAPGNQIVRNYGRYTVSAENCSAPEFNDTGD